MQLADALDLIVAVPDFPKQGVQYRDITPLLADGGAFRVVCDAMAESLPDDVRMLAGLEARGFLFASAVAYARGLGVLALRKPGKLPRVADTVSYSLEYGTASVQLPADVVRPGDGVVIIDDVLATGGTLAAAVELLQRAQAQVLGAVVVMELGALEGRALLPEVEVHALRCVG